jgi:integrase
MALDYQEAYTILDEYKRKALNEENNDLEASRHIHLGKLADIKIANPILGTIQLDGASPKVIKPMIETFEALAHCSMNDHKKQIIKMGKQLVKRGTPEIKHLFAKLRKDDKALLTFLQLLLKTEGEILQIDYDRAVYRFGLDTKKVNLNTSQATVQDTSFIETQKKNYTPLEDIVDDFLFSETACDYKREDLEESKKQCYKMNKIIEVLIDYLHDRNNKATSRDITLKTISAVFDIIPDIPRKPSQITTAYPYYAYYEKLKETNYKRKSISSIQTDLLNYNRFIKYLEDKGYITADDLKQTQKQYSNIKKRLTNSVKNGSIKDKEKRGPYKTEMLKCLFNSNNNPYKQLIDVFLGNKKLIANQNIDDYWARYFLPLIMFFTGARPTELSFIKTSDCELKIFNDNKERLIMYIEDKTKTISSRRIILIHDFLANDLGFIDYVKKAQKQKRENLFNTERDVSNFVGTEFNRSTIKKNCIEPFITREDKFNKAQYVMYSLRHNYKTHMIFNNKYDSALVHKIQGHKDEKVSANYISTYSEQIIEFVNDFNLYKIIDWTEFKKVSEKI